MKLYKNIENNNKRKDKLLKRLYDTFVCFGITGMFIAIPYTLIASFFRYNSNYLNINYTLMKFFARIAYEVNLFLTRKTVFKSFDTKDLPGHGHFILFNHVNEVEFPFDIHFSKGTPTYDINAMKKLGPIYFALKSFGVPLYPGKEIKKSVDLINEYLESTNILVYPEGERTFSDQPKIYKKGILKLIYDQKHKAIVFYKGGFEKLDRNVYYYKSEIIDSSTFNTFEDFYDHITETTKTFSKSFLDKK